MESQKQLEVSSVSKSIMMRSQINESQSTCQIATNNVATTDSKKNESLSVMSQDIRENPQGLPEESEIFKPIVNKDNLQVAEAKPVVTKQNEEVCDHKKPISEIARLKNEIEELAASLKVKNNKNSLKIPH